MKNFYSYYHLTNAEGMRAINLEHQKAVNMYWIQKEEGNLIKEYIEVNYRDKCRLSDKRILMSAISDVMKDPSGVLIISEIDVIGSSLIEKLETYRALNGKLKSCDMSIMSPFQIMAIHEHKALIEENSGVIEIISAGAPETPRTTTKKRSAKKNKVHRREERRALSSSGTGVREYIVTKRKRKKATKLDRVRRVDKLSFRNMKVGGIIFKMKDKQYSNEAVSKVLNDHGYLTHRKRKFTPSSVNGIHSRAVRRNVDLAHGIKFIKENGLSNKKKWEKSQKSNNNL